MKCLVLVFLAVFSYPAAGTLQIDPAASRIINGNVAAEQEFRHAVSIQLIGNTQNTRGHICGGTLISLLHVLTASSCLYRNNILIQAAQYRVFGGTITLTNDTVPERIRTIADITIHPDYFGTPAFANDIAIITLTTPFLASTVTPLSLPSGSEPKDFTLCTTAGWGGSLINNNNPSVTLRYAVKYIYNHQLCAMLYNTQPGQPNILDNMLCAASYNIISGGCDSDRGNALVCDGVLTGLLSVSTNCQTVVRPEIYTKIAAYNSWITSVTGASSVTLPGSLVIGVMILLQAVIGRIHE